MKIAVATEDGQSVSQHFGRAPYYAVITIEDGVIAGRELRPRSTPHLAGAPRDVHTETGPHGIGPEAQARHDQMAQAISDCVALIAGGMGQGAHDRFAALGLKPVVTELPTVDAAALAYARGQLVDRLERLD